MKTENIYFAGGMYSVNASEPDKRTFGMVHCPPNKRPYLTHKRNGLQLTSHHANLYVLSPDGTTATLVDPRCIQVLTANRTVVLTEEQQKLIQESIRTGYFFD